MTSWPWSRGSLLYKDCYSDNSSLQGRRPVQHHINVLYIYMCVFLMNSAFQMKEKWDGWMQINSRKKLNSVFGLVGSVVHSSRPHLRLLHGDAALRPEDWPIELVSLECGGECRWSWSWSFFIHSRFLMAALNILPERWGNVCHWAGIRHSVGAHALTVVINEEFL